MDNSTKVGVVMMILFGAMGLAISGLGGALVGAIGAFGVTSLIFALIEYFEREGVSVQETRDNKLKQVDSKNIPFKAPVDHKK